MQQKNITKQDNTTKQDNAMKRDNSADHDFANITKNRIDNLKNAKNIIWCSLLGMAVITILLMFSLKGILKLFFVGGCIFLMTILFFIYRHTNNEIMTHIDELFHTN